MEAALDEIKDPPDLRLRLLPWRSCHISLKEASLRQASEHCMLSPPTPGDCTHCTLP